MRVLVNKVEIDKSIVSFNSFNSVNTTLLVSHKLRDSLNCDCICLCGDISLLSLYKDITLFTDCYIIFKDVMYIETEQEIDVSTVKNIFLVKNDNSDDDVLYVMNTIFNRNRNRNRK